MSLGYTMHGIIFDMDSQSLIRASRIDDVLRHVSEGASLSTACTLLNCDIQEVKNHARTSVVLAERLMQLEKSLYETLLNRPTAVGYEIWRELQGGGPGNSQSTAKMKLSTYNESDFDAK